jgi:outer membrane lipoprotein-sorting protein
MSVMTRVWLRWLPAVVVPLAIASGALAGSALAGAAVTLPDKTPAQVLALAAGSHVTALSGTLSETSDLGLPQLPAGSVPDSSGAASALSMLTSPYTAQLYVDGPRNVRLQVLDQMNERDVVRHGNDLWYYDSANNTAVHATIPAKGAAALPGTTNPRLPGTKTPDTLTPGIAAPGTPAVETPAGLAQQMLAAITPSTTVTVGTNVKVAGRGAYDLVLSPRSTGTLVQSVSIAVDAQTGLPLSVTILANGQAKPAFQLAFTSLTLAAPSASVFAFTPPAGAAVTQQALPTPSRLTGPLTPASPLKTLKVLPKVRLKAAPFTVVGAGWDAVIELPAGTVPADVASSPLLSGTTTAVPGGRLLQTSLINVLFANNGRVYAGSVPSARLLAVADGG